MDVVLLKSYIAVAEHGSFTAAAETLSYSQSTVSGHVRRLEHLVGTQLFHRDAPLRLTRRGAELLPHARSIMSDLARFQPDSGHGDERRRHP